MLNYYKYCGDIKLFVFDMIVYLEFSKDSMQKHNGVKIQLGKMIRYPINF